MMFGVHGKQYLSEKDMILFLREAYETSFGHLWSVFFEMMLHCSTSPGHLGCLLFITVFFDRP